MEKLLQNALTIRGDCLYCPLCLSIDSYWNCEADCNHCFFRRLNRTWGNDLRPADTELLERKLRNGLNNQNPKSSLAYALKLKKTIRFGSKTDPWQDCERKLKVSSRILEILRDLEWTFVIQTRFLGNLIYELPTLTECHSKALVTVMPVISPGLEKDWQILERGRTTPIPERIHIIRKLIQDGFPVGVNGEPFIPGYHTIKDFEDTCKLLKSAGVQTYNIYNFHFNDYVAKRMWAINIDIEKIWEANQDDKWHPILQKLLDVAKRVGIKLGCPDFVNTGWGYKEPSNTCCGVTAMNPVRFNSHWFKKLKQKGFSNEDIIEKTWEGIGDYDEGLRILYGTKCNMYTMGDIKP